MTTNVQYTVEHRRLLRNSHCLSASSDSVDSCSSNGQSELVKVTHLLHYPGSRTSFSDTLTSCRKTEALLKLSYVSSSEFLTSTAKINVDEPS